MNATVKFKSNGPSDYTMDHETCPICWRPFSQETVPVCLGCGHSCCRDCSLAIRTCSLCRYKMPSSFQRRPNYSILSMIERQARRETVERTSQTTQTDAGLMTITPQGRGRQTKPSLLEGKAMTVAIKRNGIELVFK